MLRSLTRDPPSATWLKTPRENSKIQMEIAPVGSTRFMATRLASGDSRGNPNQSGEPATPIRSPFRLSHVICLFAEPRPKTSAPLADKEKLASWTFCKNPTDSATITASPVVFNAYLYCIRGRDTAKCALSLADGSNLVTATGGPPPREVRYRVRDGKVEKRITPFAFHVPPRPRVGPMSATSCAAPVTRSVRLSLSPEKKATDLLSVDQNGL
jgi:hypothetical protein